ncbi:MAG: mechanosensitive ion channel [Dysgonamonadaceae bacterium]|jgi:small conductance mechanosensitive channel|nr:mechanosensitive ion channel [Dysgonamonadaceae bacterium]
MDIIKDILTGVDSWPDLGAKLWPLLISFSLKLLASIVVYIVGRKLIKALNKFTDKMMNIKGFEPSVASFIRSLINIALTAVLIYLIVDILGITTTSLVALFASIGVALGMALSGTLQNFAGGIMILIFRPYKVGDYIEAQGQGGTVKEIQIFNTIIITTDNRTIYIPNGGLSTNVIVNYNNQTSRRVEWVFGVAYGTGFEQVKQIIRDILKADSRIFPNPAPEIVIKALNESSVDIQVRVWVARTDYWDVLYSINEQIYTTFNAKGIDIPFPQMTVHLVDKKS